MKRNLAAQVAGAFFCTLAAPAAAAEDRSQPNILWISAEDLSPDLGCYGDAYARTPNLDRLAAEGARFARAFAVAGVCAPSRSAIITGMYPTSIGTHHMRCKGVPPEFVRCFTEHLRAAGYYTTNNAKTDYNFDAPLTAWDENGRSAHWRGRAPGQPFFSVFNLTVTHESQIRSTEEQFQKNTKALGPEDRHDPAKAVLPPYYPDTPVVRKDWARYHDLITAMDRQAGDILKQLADDGLAESTIVFFFGDHGRGLPRAKRWVYDAGIRVPLLVRWPGRIASGAVREDLVSLIDLAPTLLSIAGVEPPAHFHGTAFLGDRAAPPREHIFAHRDRMDETYDIIRAVRDGRFKYIRNFQPGKPYAQYIHYMEEMPTMKEMRRLNKEGVLVGPQKLFFLPEKPEEELYDVTQDPHEVRNLADRPEHAKDLERLRGALEGWMRETGDLGLIKEDVLNERARPGGVWSTAAAPEILPAGGSFEGPVRVKIACATPGASIAYTLDAGEKARFSLYNGEFTVEGPAVVRAKACRLGFRDSPEVLVSFLHSGLVPAAVAAPRPPNVVLVITDDQGHGDLGFHGNPRIRTPHLDALARRSARLTRFYVSPVCSPTRASLMTGRYNYRTGVVDTYIGRSLMHSDEVTLAEMLSAAGYATGIFGKWHLGDNHPLRAMDQGFQESLVLKGGGLGQPSDLPGGSSYFDPLLLENGKPARRRGYVSDVIAEAAIRFVEAHRARPFFLYLAFNAPHAPLEVPEYYRAMYRDLEDEKTARVYGMVTNIDDNLGRLFAKLDEVRIAEDTIVVFLTDNGPQWPRYTSGFRGTKGTVYEGGIRVPCFIRWPGRFPGDRDIDRIAAHIDLAPTILEACGVERPAAVRFDGVSLLPLLRDEKVEWIDRTIHLQWHRGDRPEPFRAFAAVGQRWKLLAPRDPAPAKVAEPPQLELYDLIADPGEAKDLAAGHPGVVEILRRGYEAWLRDVSATRGFDPPRIRLGTEHENPVILTRQDWRGPRAGWRPDDLGHWEVEVARAGDYEFTLHFAAKGAGAAQVALGAVAAEKPIAEGQATAALGPLRLEAGPGRLEASITPAGGGEPRGVDQLEVKRAAPAASAPHRPTNVVIVLADDLGWGDLGCFGHPKFRTPHLDRLAAEGARLTSFYVPVPFCAPSRAALLTGRYPFRSGFTRNPAPKEDPLAKNADHLALPVEETTLAELFRKAGYRTALFGKWHLGHRPQFRPLRRGFDEYLGILYSNDMHRVELIDGDATVEYPVVQATLQRRLTDRALRFIETTRERPFFLFLSSHSPHKPLAASEDFYGRSGAGLYGDAVAELDGSVGEIVAKLRALDLDRSTLLLFTSDNGPWYGGSTGGLRGMKGQTWEGGLRVPLIARWPGRIPEGHASAEPAVIMDLFATALAAAGIALPADRRIDGKDILTLLTSSASSPHEAVFAFRGERVAAVRSGRWKLHLAAPGPARERVWRPGEPWTDPRRPDGVRILAPFEQAHPSQFPGVQGGDPVHGTTLFDLESDPAEQRDVADAHQEVVARLRALAEKLKKD